MTLATVVVRLRVIIPAFNEQALFGRSLHQRPALPDTASVALETLVVVQERLDQVALAADAPRSEEAR
jgi:hypothetical protein